MAMTFVLGRVESLALVLVLVLELRLVVETEAGIVESSTV